MASYSNVQEVAKYFGISESTVRLWVKKGTIARDCYIKADLTYRFDITAIEKQLREGKFEEDKSEEGKSWQEELAEKDTEISLDDDF